MNTIKITEADLRALAWEEDSNPQTYHVVRCDECGMPTANGDGLCVEADDTCDAYYGASATLPDGRTISVAADEADNVMVVVDGEDATVEITDSDERYIDWANITGITIGDGRLAEQDRKYKAICDWCAELYAHGGRIMRIDCDYSNVYYLYVVRDGDKPDALVGSDAYAVEDAEDAGDMLAKAILYEYGVYGDRYYCTVDASGLDSISWCGQAGDDLTRKEAIADAKATLAGDETLASVAVDCVPISCYQCDSSGGWMWWRAGDAVRDCVITREEA